MSGTTHKKNAWEIYRVCFEEGDCVVLVTDDDVFDWGRLKSSDEGLTLSWPGKQTRFYDWEDIRFMAHDGFPVKKIMGKEPEVNLRHFKTKIAAIREKFHFGRLIQELWGGCTSMHFGDPFEILDVSATLVNPGNCLYFASEEEYHQNYLYEEVIMCEAKDGAKGLLWDLPTIHEFEVAA